jgi:type I restriction enzyme, S subunit
MDSEKKLPEGWKWERVRNIAELIRGINYTKNVASDHSTDNNVPILRAQNIDCELNFNDLVYVPKYLIKEEQYIKKGDIIFSMSSGSKHLVGKSAIALSDYNGSYGAFCALLRVDRKTNNNFIGYIFRTSRFRKLISEISKGTSINNLKREHILNFELPLPPLRFQNQIVSKIEELFSKLDKGIENLRLAKQQLKTYRQAVLKSAFEGRFTNGNVNSDESPNRWKWVPIGDLCKCIVPNRDKPKSFTGNTKWVTTPNFKESSIRLNYTNVTPGLSNKEIDIYKAKIIPIDSVVMTCVGTFGLSAVVDQPIVINQQLHAFLSNEMVHPKYLAYCIQFNKPYFESKSTSTTIQYLNKENCNSMPFPLRSLQEQKSIVEVVENRFSLADKMEQNIHESLREAEALRQSILKCAFEGKLTSDRLSINEKIKKIQAQTVSHVK